MPLEGASGGLDAGDAAPSAPSLARYHQPNLAESAATVPRGSASPRAPTNRPMIAVRNAARDEMCTSARDRQRGRQRVPRRGEALGEADGRRPAELRRGPAQVADVVAGLNLAFHVGPG